METGALKTYNVTFASGSTFSTILNLTRSYPKVYVYVPAGGAGAAVHVNASADGGLTCVPSYTLISSSTVQFARVTVPSSVTNSVVELPGGFTHYQLDASAAVTNGATFKVFGNY
jgi:hypothetical protein